MGHRIKLFEDGAEKRYSNLIHSTFLVVCLIPGYVSPRCRHVLTNNYRNARYYREVGQQPLRVEIPLALHGSDCHLKAILHFDSFNAICVQAGDTEFHPFIVSSQSSMLLLRKLKCYRKSQMFPEGGQGQGELMKSLLSVDASRLVT
jgi:hypothetical protein